MYISSSLLVQGLTPTEFGSTISTIILEPVVFAAPATPTINCGGYGPVGLSAPASQPTSTTKSSSLTFINRFKSRMLPFRGIGSAIIPALLINLTFGFPSVTKHQPFRVTLTNSQSRLHRSTQTSSSFPSSDTPPTLSAGIISSL